MCAICLTGMAGTIQSIRRMSKVKKRLRMAAYERVAASCGKWRRSYLVAIRMLMAREDATFEYELDRVLGFGLKAYCPELLAPAEAAVAKQHPNRMIAEAAQISAEQVEVPVWRQPKPKLEPPPDPLEELQEPEPMPEPEQPKPSAIQLPKRAVATSRAVAPERPSAIERPGRVAPVEPAPQVLELPPERPEGLVDQATADRILDAIAAPVAPSPLYEVCPGCKQEKPSSVMPVHRQNCDAARSGLR